MQCFVFSECPMKLSNQIFLIHAQGMHPGDTSDTYPTLNITSCVHYYLPLLQTLTKMWEKEQLELQAEEIVEMNEGEEEGEGKGISSLVGIVDCFSSLIMLTKFEGHPHTKAGSGLNRRAILLIALREVRDHDVVFCIFILNCCVFYCLIVIYSIDCAKGPVIYGYFHALK